MFNAIVVASNVYVQVVPKHHHEQLPNASVFNDQHCWKVLQLITAQRFLTLRPVGMFSFRVASFDLKVAIPLVVNTGLFFLYF